MATLLYFFVSFFYTLQKHVNHVKNKHESHYLLEIDVNLLLRRQLSSGGESRGSSRRSVRKYLVKSLCPEGHSQTIGTYQCRNH